VFLPFIKAQISLSRPEFELQNEKLVNSRFLSSCGLINDKDGNKVVAIVGGKEAGMDIWNPKTSEIQLLWDEIPPEKEASNNLQDAQMITVNEGSEFLLYGGYLNQTYLDTIWKYSVVNNTWER